MKAAEDAGEEYYDPNRKDNILGRNETISALWEEHFKGPIVCVTCGREDSGLVPRVVGQTVVEKGLAFSGRVGQCASTFSFLALERPREVWAVWRALFLLDSEETDNGAEQ